MSSCDVIIMTSGLTFVFLQYPCTPRTRTRGSNKSSAVFGETDLPSWRHFPYAGQSLQREKRYLFVYFIEFFILQNFLGSSHSNFACLNIILRGRKCARGKKNGEDRGGEVFEIYGEGDMQMEQILLCSDATPGMRESF